MLQRKKMKTQGEKWADGEILHAGNRSSTVATPGVSEPLSIYSDGLSIRGAAHCGRAFRMAFTSSATAVNANSNWSWSESRGERRGAVGEQNTTVRWKFGSKKQQTNRIWAATVPWCEPSLVSGPGCVPEWQRCQSPSHLEPREQDKQLSLSWF